MFTKNKLIHFSPVLGNFLLMILTYYYFSWSVLFLFFFFILEVSFFDFFQYLKNKEIAKQVKFNSQNSRLLKTYILLIGFALLEFLFLGFLLLYEKTDGFFLNELSSFFMYEEFGISQGYFLLPLLLLSSFMKSNQEKKQGQGAFYALEKKTINKAIRSLSIVRIIMIASALLLIFIKFEYTYLIWMFIFSVLMAQRIIFWKKIEITSKGYAVYN